MSEGIWSIAISILSLGVAGISLFHSKKSANAAEESAEIARRALSHQETFSKEQICKQIVEEAGVIWEKFNPDKCADYIRREWEYRKHKGFTKDDFERVMQAFWTKRGKSPDQIAKIEARMNLIFD